MRLAQCLGPTKIDRYSLKGLQMLNIDLLSVIIPALFAMKEKRGKKALQTIYIFINRDE